MHVQLNCRVAWSTCTCSPNSLVLMKVKLIKNNICINLRMFDTVTCILSSIFLSYNHITEFKIKTKNGDQCASFLHYGAFIMTFLHCKYRGVHLAYKLFLYIFSQFLSKNQETNIYYISLFCAE